MIEEQKKSERRISGSDTVIYQGKMVTRDQYERLKNSYFDSDDRHSDLHNDLHRADQWFGSLWGED